MRTFFDSRRIVLVEVVLFSILTMLFLYFLIKSDFNNIINYILLIILIRELIRIFFLYHTEIRRITLTPKDIIIKWKKKEERLHYRQIKSVRYKKTVRWGSKSHYLIVNFVDGGEVVYNVTNLAFLDDLEGNIMNMISKHKHKKNK